MVIAAKKVKVFPPVKMGDVLAEDFLGTGVDLIASETISE
jgi:CxxC motif-containing protein